MILSRRFPSLLIHSQLALLTCMATPALAEEPAPADTEGEEADAPANAELETARLHFKNGVDLVQEKNYQDAYRQFQLALEKSDRSWKVLGNIGLCALKLERDGEALVFYEEYLEKGGSEINPDERSHIEREILLLKGNMATVRLESSDPNAKISVKRAGSSVPTQLYELADGKTELGLRAGSLTIVAKSQGKKLQHEIVLSAGEDVQHVFDFDAEEASTEPASVAETTELAPSSIKEESGFTGLQYAGFATAGLGVVALGGGALFGVLSQGQESDARDTCLDGICSSATESDIDSAQSKAMLANIMFIAGGVLATAGVSMVVFGGESESEKVAGSSLKIAPLWGPTGGGVFATGSF